MYYPSGSAEFDRPMSWRVEYRLNSGSPLVTFTSASEALARKEYTEIIRVHPYYCALLTCVQSYNASFIDYVRDVA